MIDYPKDTSWDVYVDGERVNPNLKHPYQGVTKVRYFSDWEKPIEAEEEINGDLWLDLWFAADDAVRATGDLHHRHIEGFDQDPDDPTILNLNTGS